ncbi:MAG: prepilin-type N-terminal cleavage/methylation domain-containing protein [Verrucomicrobiales bacterium]|nr:prepilin-type N-terminal cleavage/methylation domain-containing protein [Verrucomicrobiales bacterium]
MIRTSSHSPSRAAGFTLIELLTVMAIIAVLAGLTVGLTSAARSAKTNSRMKADLQQLQTAIENYKADRNAYPPDHKLPAGSSVKVNPAVNQLFYELRGLDVANGEFRVRGSSQGLTPEQVERVFGRKGFLNASVDTSEPARSYFDPKASQVKRTTIDGVPVDLLVTAFDWPASAPEAAPLAGNRSNPWRYVSTSPTNNASGFDLWAEVYVGSEKRIFKNW